MGNVSHLKLICFSHKLWTQNDCSVLCISKTRSICFTKTVSGVLPDLRRSIKHSDSTDDSLEHDISLFTNLLNFIKFLIPAGNHVIPIIVILCVVIVVIIVYVVLKRHRERASEQLLYDCSLS